MAMSPDREANLSKALSMVTKACSKGAKIVCLPELFTSLYFPQAKYAGEASEKIPGPTTEALSKCARENSVVLIGGSIFEEDGASRYNTSVVFDSDGAILGKYRKVHIPDDESFYEQDYFESGAGYRSFDSSVVKIGVLICFDQWYPEPARAVKLAGADVLFYPTAIGLVRGIRQSEGSWKEAWEGVQRGHAISNSLVVAAANRTGREGRMRFWGGSFVCDQFGKILARADEREQVVLANCRIGLGRDIEEGWGFLRNRKPSTYGALIQ